MKEAPFGGTLRLAPKTEAAMLHIDADGPLLATSTLRARDLPGLRGAQALAATSPAGMQIARELLQAKVSGQASLLQELPAGGHARPEVDRALANIERASTLRELLEAEARAATAYWAAWAALPVPIAATRKRQERSPSIGGPSGSGARC
jgi:CRISPR/Cas system-associated endonuclease Cas1